METNLNTKIYNADLYMRLSKEDGDKEESDSITNQKELIFDYLKSRMNIRIHKIRVDDGYSGISFERPAFQQMLEDIKAGKVDCVITKDLSRFGRNHIEVGKYLEKIFPYLGVRFIAINDNYDSAMSDMQTDNIIIPFKNLINDAYCRDISIKIRSNLEIKRKKGDFVGAFAPYGYRKSETDKNRLEIDEEAAETVRRIFKMYLQGSSAYRIAEALNREDALTPMDYKKEQGSAFYTGFKKNLKGKWSHVHVLRILGNPVYMGTLIQGKNTTPNYKVKKKVKKEEDKWCRVENAHEAIIPAADFKNVQKILRMDIRTGTAQDKVYYLSGLVRCGNCGGNMVRKTVPSGHKQFIYYVCGNHKANKEVCSLHSINAKKLEESVLLLLNKQIESVVDMDHILGQIEKIQCQSGELEKKNRQIIKKKEKIQKYSNLRMDLYEDYIDGLITREEYRELKENYGKRIQNAEQGLETLEEGLKLLAAGLGHTWGWLTEFKRLGYLESLSREVIVSLIDRIYVYEKKKRERYPRIEVRFKYAEEFLSLTEDMLLGREGEPEEKKEVGYGENK